MQKQIRDQLEYGKYQGKDTLTVEEYVVVQLIERSKYLRSTFTRHELVLKLTHHFHRDRRFASNTQGIKTIEDLLILLSQSEHMFHTEYRNKTNFVQREENCCQEKNTMDSLNAGKREVRERERDTKLYSTVGPPYIKFDGC